nr:23S rRNA (uracil(1939)-C(5))-methyltransferase RlmD [Desulfobulbaceae bacterium]
MKKERHSVEIEKIVLGGQGLARLPDGLVVLVDSVLPGETVTIELSSKKKQYAQAKLLEVVESSPHRIVPPCKYYADCGGCDLQHFSYTSQLAVKNNCFTDTVERALGAELFSAIQIEPVLSSVNEFYYRQRIRLQRDRYGELGFYKKGSHDVVDIDSCLLAVAEINSVLSSLKECAHRSLIENAVAVELNYSPLDGKVIIIVHLARKPRATDIASAKKIADEIALVKSVWIAVEGFSLNGPYLSGANGDTLSAQTIEFLLEGASQSEKLKFSIEPGGFCQVNLEQNQRLVSLLLDWVRECSVHGRVLDLFSGMGNFSLPLAQLGLEVMATDVQRAAIRSGQLNADRNNIISCSFARSDAFSAIKKLAKDSEKFELILLDPPRQGCKNITQYLPALGAEYIIYISCDPATLARDLAHLSKIGYSIKKCRAVDMFPQTHHIESISLLKRDLSHCGD